ncbi:MAG: cysteine--tRNA ligase [Firmicutes bacterium]|nr:cysteine--tRNA ligase [Bacillota bacterium]
MKLYNTMSRRKEDFVPMDGKTATIYSCGPTVYGTASIGNLRAYIFTDILKRGLLLAGFGIKDVINTTDVGHLQSDADDGEDKIEVAARKAKLDPAAIAQQYTDEFLRDCDALNILRPKKLVPATSCVDKMIEHIAGLEKLGYTYITSDGVYFDSSKFERYWDMQGKPKEGKGDKAGARIDMGEKRNAHDFALWKFTPPTALQKWDSPWGVGCPGWHIECSAIIRKHLGDTIDIHTGGIDHIPIHHTNEIAQSEALTGKTFARFWMHNEFMKVDGTKMSKSLGNVYTLPQLAKRGFTPMAFRYFVLGAHYRTILNFTFEALEGAQNAYNNLVKEVFKHYHATTHTPVTNDDFATAILDDLNTPRALAAIWELLREKPNRGVYDLIVKFDKTLGLGLEAAVSVKIIVNEIPTSIKELAEKRFAAKQKKDFTAADKLRAEVQSMGYEILDSKDSYEIKKI